MRKVLVLLLAFIIPFAAFAELTQDDLMVLMTKNERESYRKLKTDAEKQEFLKDFWADRDPNPSTPENEYKTEIERRVQYINEKVKALGAKGAQTDLGKTFLLLGQPSDQRFSEGEEPTQVWVYHSLPAEIAQGQLELHFVANEDTGAFDFRDPGAANQVLEKARVHWSKLASLAPPPPAKPETKQDQKTEPLAEKKPAVELSAEVKAALDGAVAGKTAKKIAFDSRIDSFMTSTGEIFATIAINSKEDLAAGKVGVRTVDPSGATGFQSEWPFSQAEEKPGYFQTMIPATVGQSKIAVAVVAGSKSGAAIQPVTISDYANKFSLSSLLMGKEYKELQVAKPEKEPYTFGKFKLYPSFDNTFAKLDQFILVFEIYNFQTDAASGKPNMGMTISFQKEKGPIQKTPAAPPEGHIIGKKMTVPVGYPLKEFEPGTYQVTVSVTDKLRNETTTREGKIVIQ